MNLERTEVAQRDFDKNCASLDPVESGHLYDDYRPFQTIVEDDHVGFDENGDYHAVPEEHLEAYAEVADVIVLFGLEGVEIVTEDEYRDGK